jgi:hypothetical protein
VVLNPFFFFGFLFSFTTPQKKTQADRGDRTPDLPLTKRLPCHLAISASYAHEGH